MVNPEADAVNFFSFNLALNMGEFLSSDEWDNVEISINANNLLNKNLMFAELSRRAVNTSRNRKVVIYLLRFKFHFSACLF